MPAHGILERIVYAKKHHLLNADAAVSSKADRLSLGLYRAMMALHCLACAFHARNCDKYQHTIYCLKGINHTVFFECIVIKLTVWQE